MEFSIESWAASAPGLSDARDWRSWSEDPRPPGVGPAPELRAIPPMQRRRISTLGRHALLALEEVSTEAAPEAPRVYASRFGELKRSAELLEQLFQDGGPSPMSFSLSVHNAIGALSSIARADTLPYTAVAAGEETLEAALLEAAGLLADGAPEVLIVIYEDAIPEPWREFDALPEAAFPRAVALRVRPPQGPSGFRLRCEAADGATPAATSLPPELQLVKFLCGGAERMTRVVGARRWEWTRRG